MENKPIYSIDSRISLYLYLSEFKCILLPLIELVETSPENSIFSSIK